MRTVHRSVFRPVLAALRALVASPVHAQTPEEPSSRAGLMEKARETLATESVTPRRSVIERELSWYDNHLFANLLAGWTGGAYCTRGIDRPTDLPDLADGERLARR